RISTGAAFKNLLINFIKISAIIFLRQIKNRRLTTFEYDSVVNYAVDIGIENCYIQIGKTADEKFVPNFDGRGVQKFAD
ncbi:MAG: hypothetical protein IJT73_08975, partial [Selenomonadaceae bacterium]|nr:hypothetical protein [Selenomonadaceae bacterium]